MVTDSDNTDQSTEIALLRSDLKSITDNLSYIRSELVDVRSIDKKLTSQSVTIEGLSHRVTALEREQSDFRSLFTTMQKDIIQRIQDVKDSSADSRQKDTKEILDKLDETYSKNATSQKELAGRVSALENWRWYLLGAIAVIVFMAAGLPWQIILAAP